MIMAIICWGGPPGTPEEDGDRFVEIWNLVFMQFEQVTKEERIEPAEVRRLIRAWALNGSAAVLQGTHDNYETDLFKCADRRCCRRRYRPTT